ncbi:hypothetical protein INR49_013969 [Caranx melampygus]|nr:hypothetical protein INR49_013969 [Caranx melampygus]
MSETGVRADENVMDGTPILESLLFAPLRQLVDGCVKFEVWREKFCSSRVDESVRLSDRDVCHAGNVSDLCGSLELKT